MNAADAICAARQQTAAAASSAASSVIYRLQSTRRVAGHTDTRSTGGYADRGNKQLRQVRRRCPGGGFDGAALQRSGRRAGAAHGAAGARRGLRTRRPRRRESGDGPRDAARPQQEVRRRCMSRPTPVPRGSRSRRGPALRWLCGHVTASRVDISCGRERQHTSPSDTLHRGFIQRDRVMWGVNAMLVSAHFRQSANRNGQDLVQSSATSQHLSVKQGRCT